MEGVPATPGTEEVDGAVEGVPGRAQPLPVKDAVRQLLSQSVFFFLDENVHSHKNS